MTRSTGDADSSVGGDPALKWKSRIAAREIHGSCSVEIVAYLNLIFGRPIGRD